MADNHSSYQTDSWTLFFSWTQDQRRCLLLDMHQFHAEQLLETAPVCCINVLWELGNLFHHYAAIHSNLLWIYRIHKSYRRLPCFWAHGEISSGWVIKTVYWCDSFLVLLWHSEKCYYCFKNCFFCNVCVWEHVQWATEDHVPCNSICDHYNKIASQSNAVIDGSINLWCCPPITHWKAKTTTRRFTKEDKLQ